MSCIKLLGVNLRVIEQTKNDNPTKAEDADKAIFEILKTLAVLMSDIENPSQFVCDEMTAPLQQLIIDFDLQAVIKPMLVSSDPDFNLKAVIMLGSIYSWPASCVSQVKIDEPYDSLLMVFVTPYLNYFRTMSPEAEKWLCVPKLRCHMISQVMWALSNIFADPTLAT